MKKILTSVLLPLLGLPALAQTPTDTAPADPLEFTVNGVNYTILNEQEKTCQTKAGESRIDYETRKFVTVYGNEIEGEVTVPATVLKDGQDAYTVVAIGSFSFGKASTVTIEPGGVTSIAPEAFNSNQNLTTVTIPDAVSSIGEYAFAGCINLKTVTLPASLTGIAKNTFASSGITSISIPESVTYIGDNAFSSCESLTSVELPNSVLQIGQYSFYRCLKLSSVVLSESLSNIPNNAFAACALTSVTIPANVTSIGESGLNCSSLKEIVCLNKAIPAISYNSFNASSYSNAVLKVYKTAIPAYQKSSLWGSFVNIEAIQIEPDGVSVSPSTLTLNLGLTGQLSAVLTPEEATGDITWAVTSATPEGAVTVDENGLVTARKIGTAIVTATSGQYSATSNVVVTANSSELVKVNPLVQDLYAGDQVTMTAVVLPSTITPSLTWSSSNTSVATIDEISGILTALAPGATVITATNDNISGKLAITVLEVLPEEVTLDQETLSLEVGQTGVLKATVSPSNVTYPNVTWETSDPNVAVVTDGTVTAMGVGSATIRAMCGGYTANCVVTVNPTLATSVTLSATTATLKANQTLQLNATVAPENTTDKSIEWVSDNSNVATVSSNGLVTAVSVGSATIIAECGDVSATCTITVEATESQDIVMNAAAVTLKINQTQQLVATVLPETTTDKTVTWTSSAPSVATVDDNGLVTAVAVGSATITAQNGNLSTICEVTVEPTLAEQVILEQSSATVNVGSTVMLSGKVLPEDTTDATIVWTSSDDNVATVANGVVTGVAPGSAVITATCGSAFATANISVLLPATSITLNQTELNLEVGDLYDLIETVQPENTTDVVVWSSSDVDVATVDQYGIVSAIKAGTTTIIATCGNVNAECVVNVSDVPATSVELNMTTLSLKTGQSQQLVATVLPENTTNPTVNWESSDTTVATVAADGTVTAVAAGTAVISATCGNVNAECEVTVSEPEIDEIVINYLSVTLKATETVQLTATLPSSLEGETVEWTSSNEKVATVSADGLVTAISIGDAVITATCNGVSATCDVTVEVTPVEMIELNVTEVSLRVNDTYELKATITPATATDDTLIWSSSNPEVVTVEDGLLTALTAGTAVITVVNGNVYASCMVTVTDDSSTIIESLEENLDGNTYIVFNLQGVNVMTTSVKSDLNKLAKGLYIINGKKVMIK